MDNSPLNIEANTPLPKESFFYKNGLKIIFITDIFFLIIVGIFFIYCTRNPELIYLSINSNSTEINQNEETYSTALDIEDYDEQIDINNLFYDDELKQYQISSEWYKYINDIAGFSIDFPSDWNVDSRESWVTFDGKGMYGSGSYFGDVNFIIEVSDINQSGLQTMIDEELAAIRDQTSTEIKTEQSEFKGQPATLASYNYRNLQTANNIFFEYQDKFFNIRYIDNATQNNSISLINQKILNSFKLLEQEAQQWVSFQTEDFNINLPQGWKIFESLSHTKYPSAKLYYLTAQMPNETGGNLKTITLYISEEDIFGLPQRFESKNPFLLNESEIYYLAAPYNVYQILGSANNKYYRIEFPEIGLNSIRYDMISTLEIK